jgi:hypothetical protein
VKSTRHRKGSVSRSSTSSKQTDHSPNRACSVNPYSGLDQPARSAADRLAVSLARCGKYESCAPVVYLPSVPTTRERLWKRPRIFPRQLYRLSGRAELVLPCAQFTLKRPAKRNRPWLRVAMETSKARERGYSPALSCQGESSVGGPAKVSEHRANAEPNRNRAGPASSKEKCPHQLHQASTSHLSPTPPRARRRVPRPCCRDSRPKIRQQESRPVEGRRDAVTE